MHRSPWAGTPPCTGRTAPAASALLAWGRSGVRGEPWTDTQLQLIALSQLHLPPWHWGRLADRMLSCSAWAARRARGAPARAAERVVHGPDRPMFMERSHQGRQHSRILSCLVQPAWRRAQVECESLWPGPAAGLTGGSWEQSKALDIEGTNGWVPRTIRPHLQPGWTGHACPRSPRAPWMGRPALARPLSTDPKTGAKPMPELSRLAQG